MKKQLLAGLATAVFLFSLVSSVYATPYTGADIELLGNDYSDISDSSKWRDIGGGAIYTPWARHWVEYTADLTAGNWNIGLNVINHGNLDNNWYSQFEVSNGIGETLDIFASDFEVNSGFFNVNLDAGEYTVKYTWLNDKWGGVTDELQRDANIQINSAFFDNTETAPVPEPATLLLLGSGLAGLAFYRRKKMK